PPKSQQPGGIINSTDLSVRARQLHVSALSRQAELHLKLEGAGLNDLLEELQLIQPGAVQLAAQRAPRCNSKQLCRIVDRVEAAGTMSEFSEAAADFVLLLLAASGNHSLRFSPW